MPCITEPRSAMRMAACVISILRLTRGTPSNESMVKVRRLHTVYDAHSSGSPRVYLSAALARIGPSPMVSP